MNMNSVHTVHLQTRVLQPEQCHLGQCGAPMSRMGPALQAMPLLGKRRLAQVTFRGLHHLVQEGALQSLHTDAM